MIIRIPRSSTSGKEMLNSKFEEGPFDIWGGYVRHPESLPGKQQHRNEYTHKSY